MNPPFIPAATLVRYWPARSNSIPVVSWRVQRIDCHGIGSAGGTCATPGACDGATGCDEATGWLAGTKSDGRHSEDGDGHNRRHDRGDLASLHGTSVVERRLRELVCGDPGDRMRAS